VIRTGHSYDPYPPLCAVFGSMLIMALATRIGAICAGRPKGIVTGQ
jgi:hypothetical protein